MAKIAVIGSASADLVVEAPKRPSAGETLFGTRFFTACGGKGANQAIAAARLGAEVYMVGAVGTDAYGEMLLENYKNNGVNTQYVRVTDAVGTGTAHIILAEGDNSILVVPGANYDISREDIDHAWEMLQQMDIVLLQHEIPKEVIVYAIEKLGKAGVDVLLNPAPAQEMPAEVLAYCRYLTPNEHEFEVLFPDKEAPADLQDKLIVTRGKAGADYYENGQAQRVPTFTVEAVDTTGAGDTFNGALAVAYAEGMEMAQALRFANAAAALSVMGLGAQGGMPKREEVEEFLACK